LATAKDGVHSSVIACKSDASFLDPGHDRIQELVDRLVSKGKLDASNTKALLGKITYTTDRDALNNADMIVEAIIENMDLKKGLYSNLGARCKPGTIFASNTSSLSIDQMALASGCPEKFVGVHFFNPVQLMKLVEVVRTKHTIRPCLTRWIDMIYLSLLL
jgi:3-hydroxyacyl-CoA dehydrogenase